MGNLADGHLPLMRFGVGIARRGWAGARHILNTLSVEDVLAAALVGGLLALPQWWLLRTRLRQAFWWLLANLLGWGLVGAVSGKSITSLFEMLVVGVIPAFATGVGCWLLLDRLAPPEQTNE